MRDFLRPWIRSFKSQRLFYLCVVALAALCWQLKKEAPRDLAKVRQAIETAHAAHHAAAVSDYVQAWLPRVARWELGLCAVLLLAGPWLLGRDPEPSVSSTTTRDPWQRRLWLVTGGMIVLSAVLNSPRLSNSFWMDEEWTARRFVVGEFRDREGDRPTDFREPKWRNTLFYYNDPNNHPLCSVMARLSHELFKRPLGEGTFYFREWAIRLPGFLAGLAGLAAVAWLASVLGKPRAGMLAVIWLALHPWYVRYGVDVRGYAWLIALLPLTMALLWRSIETGRVNYWLGYGLAQFLVLWAYPGALYLIFLLNLAALGMILTGPSATSRSLQVRRFAMASVLGGAFTGLMLAPCVQPMLLYLKGERIHGEFSPGRILETTSGIFTGMPWRVWDDHELALSWLRTWSHAPWLVVLVPALLAVLLVAGAVSAWRMSSRHRWLVGALLLIGPFMLTLAQLQGNILYPWYLLICLPGIAVVMGLGADALLARCRFPGRCAVPAAVLVLFGYATWPQNQLLRQHPIEPMRESVQAMRPQPNPFATDPSAILTASLCFPARLYDPAAVHVENTTELLALMAKADTTHKPLFINFADQEFLKLRDPATAKLLQDPTKFEAQPPFLGIHGQRERRVYRYLGKS